jgi:hypothetical protein
MPAAAISSPAQDVHIDLLPTMPQAVAVLPYRCGNGETRCTRAFKTKEALQQHLKSAHSTAPASVLPKPYACGVLTCSKAFESRAQLLQHTNDAHRSKSTSAAAPSQSSRARSAASPAASPSIADWLHLASAFSGLGLGSKVSFPSAPYIQVSIASFVG